MENKKILIEQGKALLAEDTDSMTSSQKDQWKARAEILIVKMRLFDFLELEGFIPERGEKG